MSDQPLDQFMLWLESVLKDCPTEAFHNRARTDLERRIRMLTMTGVPKGFTTITPYVTVEEIEAFIDFTKSAFAAVEIYRTKTPGGGTHSELRVGDSMLMCGGGAPAKGREKHAALHVYVPDTDAVYRSALEAGGEPVTAPEDNPYGERLAAVKDPTGNLWFIATPLSPADVRPQSVRAYLRRMNALGLIDFIKAAFNATEIGVYKSPEGKVMHAELRIGDAAIELGETEGEPCAIYLYVPDADAVYQQALEAGARPLSAPVDQPYGDHQGGVEDRWGNTWYIATHLGTGTET
jgi:PhnB protein